MAKSEILQEKICIPECISDEHKCKNPQYDTNKQNSTNIRANQNQQYTMTKSLHKIDGEEGISLNRIKILVHITGLDLLISCGGFVSIFMNNFSLVFLMCHFAININVTLKILK
jgi:hypothetical protein